MSQINKLFEGTKTDPAFLDELVKLLIIEGKKAAKNIIARYQIYNVVVEDLEDYILFLVNYSLENYKQTGKTFEQYAKYVFYKRLTTKIIDMFMALNPRINSLDDLLDDGTPLIEIIPNKNVSSIPDEISLEELELEMSSPKAGDSRTNKLQKKVYKLQNAGFSTKEIKSILNLTEDQLRYLIKLNNKDIKEFEFKIKIK